MVQRALHEDTVFLAAVASSSSTSRASGLFPFIALCLAILNIGEEIALIRPVTTSAKRGAS